MQLSLTHALVSIWLKLAQRVHFCDKFFMDGVNMKNSNLDALFCQLKCHMDTNRSHYKANFVNIAKRTVFLHQKTVKQVFQYGLNEKI